MQELLKIILRYPINLNAFVRYVYGDDEVQFILNTNIIFIVMLHLFVQQWNVHYKWSIYYICNLKIVPTAQFFDCNNFIIFLFFPNIC